MVLQRSPYQAKLWGYASPGDVVTIVIKEQVPSKPNLPSYQLQDSVRPDGKWLISLPPVSAGGPYRIEVTSSTDRTVLTDVMFGDVFVCAGQSNMEFTVSSTFKQIYTNAMKESGSGNYSRVRMFTVGSNARKGSIPQQAFQEIDQKWNQTSRSAVEMFSAACWFFGRDLYNKIKVPIGLVSTSWGDSKIECWLPSKAFKQCPGAGTCVTALVSADRDLDPRPPQPEWNPSFLWNANVAPMVDMAIRGILWYQGESNLEDLEYYKCAFPALIEGWRKEFQSHPEQLPFVFVQLHPFPGTLAIPQLRLDQVEVLHSVPNVGMISAVDLGDATSPFQQIHSRRKLEIGHRLASQIGHMVYGGTTSFQYPNATRANQMAEYGRPCEVMVEFDPATLPDGGLSLLKNNSCPREVGDKRMCRSLEVMLGGEWEPAFAYKLVANKTHLVVNAPGCRNRRITDVRYLYGAWPVSTVFSREGLPALPFWLPVGLGKCNLGKTICGVHQGPHQFHSDWMTRWTKIRLAALAMLCCVVFCCWLCCKRCCRCCRRSARRSSPQAQISPAVDSTLLPTTSTVYNRTLQANSRDFHATRRVA
eukprot:TRINITY_DN7409_c0_g1_i1.p1 TRINITY_DN7409_c0_g1~~TRINITY_DN7409_c0_g1_i1.p1  ORF type:complete len:663 (-),score=-69.51 TRINITY_DN7409_c0_g1_i1:90-1856(-)